MCSSKWRISCSKWWGDRSVQVKVAPRAVQSGRGSRETGCGGVKAARLGGGGGDVVYVGDVNGAIAHVLRAEGPQNTNGCISLTRARVKSHEWDLSGTFISPYHPNRDPLDKICALWVFICVLNRLLC